MLTKDGIAAHHIYHHNQRNLENCKIKQSNRDLSLCFTCRNSQSLLNSLGHYESPRSQYHSRNFPNLLNHRIAGCSFCYVCFFILQNEDCTKHKIFNGASKLKIFCFPNRMGFFSSMDEKIKRAKSQSPWLQVSLVL